VPEAAVIIGFVLRLDPLLVTFAAAPGHYVGEHWLATYALLALAA
jgi:hypothetical protein